MNEHEKKLRELRQEQSRLRRVMANALLAGEVESGLHCALDHHYIDQEAVDIQKQLITERTTKVQQFLNTLINCSGPTPVMIGRKPDWTGLVPDDGKI